MSKWSLHVKTWGECEACRLHKCRNKVVLYRGKIPCDILLVGEAPGESEDVLGTPFRGPAGHLIDEIVEMAVEDKHTVGFTNIVACIPREKHSRRKAVEPLLEEISACQERLQECITIANPKLIVAVGKLSATQLGLTQTKRSTNMVTIPDRCRMVTVDHPAYILRSSSFIKDSLVQKATMIIYDAVQKLETDDGEAETKTQTTGHQAKKPQKKRATVGRSRRRRNLK